MVQSMEGVDYKETYSPVSIFTSVRMLLTIVVLIDLELHQLDVKMTFLNSDLEEEIYMLQFERFNIESQKDKVRRLTKTICGLK